jgi:hypothetical protein
MQSDLDYLYSAFVDSIAADRKVSTETVLANMADGRIFSGRQAIQAGLADGMMSMDDMVGHMRDRATTMKRKPTSVSGGKATAENPQGGKSMTKAELKEQHPALYSEVLEEGKQAGIEGRDAAVTTERARIVGILGIPGPAATAHRQLLIEGVKDGKSAGDVALAIQHKEAELLTNAGKDLKEGAPTPAPAADSGTHTSPDAAQDAAIGDVMAKAAESWQKRN